MDTLVPGKISGKFISPVLFVDGHSKVHDFTRALSEYPDYPYEPTADWIWYKPEDDTSTNSTPKSGHFDIAPSSVSSFLRGQPSSSSTCRPATGVPSDAAQ
jgi:hypothetical protein